jgi:hypothetical protein
MVPIEQKEKGLQSRQNTTLLLPQQQQRWQ